MIRYAGLALDVPAGWEARVRRQEVTLPGRPGNAVLHLMTRPIPADRGDFGSGAVDVLGPSDAFVALLEYDRGEAQRTLFASRGVPVVRPSELSRTSMQRPLPGQTAGQWFFQAAGRPFCLFVVLGSHARRAPGAVRVNALLSRLRVEAT